MEDRETARMLKYGESKTTRIMMATVPHVTSGLGLRKFQADGLLLTRVYVVTVVLFYSVMQRPKSSLGHFIGEVFRLCMTRHAHYLGSL